MVEVTKCPSELRPSRDQSVFQGLRISTVCGIPIRRGHRFKLGGHQTRIGSKGVRTLLHLADYGHLYLVLMKRDIRIPGPCIDPRKIS